MSDPIATLAYSGLAASPAAARARFVVVCALRDARVAIEEQRCNAGAEEDKAQGLLDHWGEVRRQLQIEVDRLDERIAELQRERDGAEVRRG